MTLTFYCVIEQDLTNGSDFFMASFPDVPNVNTWGRNRAHAIEMATEALEGCLELDWERGRHLPESKYVGDADCAITVCIGDILP